jgi:hypothetical protein
MKTLALAFIIPLALLAPIGCASLTPAQNLEQGDTAASLAYAATATLLNDYEKAKPSGAAAAEAIKVKAWGLLVQERQLYAAGQSVAPLVSQLQALEASALALKNGA